MMVLVCRIQSNYLFYYITAAALVKFAMLQVIIGY
jgi:hypothetical protein